MNTQIDNERNKYSPKTGNYHTFMKGRSHFLKFIGIELGRRYVKMLKRLHALSDCWKEWRECCVNREHFTYTF